MSSRAAKRAIAVTAIALSGCVIAATRPAQEYSDTAAALRAAKEVGADTLAPEVYQQADEWFTRAKREYKLKNFFEAREALLKSRTFAERAEFDALKAGATRVSTAPKDPMADLPPPKEAFTPPNNAKFVETAEEDAKKPPPQPTPAPVTPTPVAPPPQGYPR